MAIMGDDVFSKNGSNDDKKLSNWMRKRFQLIQDENNSGDEEDKLAAGTDLRRTQQMSDYLRSAMLPPNAREQVQGAYESGLDLPRNDYSLQAERAILQQQAMHPNASAHVMDQQWAQPQSYGPPQGMMMPHQQAAPRPQPVASLSQTLGTAMGLPGVGVGEVNGHQALYPYAGQVPQYQQSMQAVGMNPNQIDTLAPGTTPQDLYAQAQRQQQRQMMMRAQADPAVIKANLDRIAGNEKATIDLRGKKYGADQDYRGARYKADSDSEATHYTADSTNEAGHYKADQGLFGNRYQADQRTASYADKNFQMGERQAFAKGGQAGLDKWRASHPRPAQGGGLGDMMNRWLGLGQQPQGAAPSGGQGMSPPQQAAPTQPQFHPQIQQVIQANPQAYAKIASNPGDLQQFQAATPEQQAQFLQWVINGGRR